MSDSEKGHAPETSDEPVNLKFNMNVSDRDPNGINEHLKVSFSEVFAEPHGNYSFDAIWKLSYTIFEGSKLWCYRIISAIFALPCALFCGCYFACVVFGQIWAYTPCIRGLSILFGCMFKMITLCVQVCCNPVNDSVARILSRIRFYHVNSGSLPTVKQDVKDFDENVALTTASLKVV
ncbi:uncharacterized protein TRIADDRAFT_56887 [Trichoplax adhaerens]|uniref:Caveolin n=1 Tax=Trichoplax adhaerens TaxID=10228 RepID=B3RWV2_TRIAD|nr:hypothetical protein TRIADDRAFT_56887 [Trichoplax adhaerens]EDV25193.1 hypothetical protein TRIADDRAFT_56887 [Trichoplax adhaerens]|eukprot:XP_002113083.1 hypothetical protein TRIADDRAFT_56887 [Trichoplax adhaerens]